MLDFVIINKDIDLFIRLIEKCTSVCFFVETIVK